MNHPGPGRGERGAFAMRIEERDGVLAIVDFGELEAYKVACRLERDGARFYTRLAERTVNPKTGEALRLLAAQERDHLEFFEGELVRLRGGGEDRFEEDDLLDVLGYGVFQTYRSIGELENALDSPRKALRLGLIVEERSLQFYEACREHAGSSPAREGLSRIIGEERAHRDLLRDMAEALG